MFDFLKQFWSKKGDDMSQAGEKIQLANQVVLVEKCRECNELMVNLDTDQLAPGDLTILKKNGVRISNPNTDKAVCLNCEYKTFGKKVADFFESDSSDDDDDDSSFFHSGGGFLGGSSFGGLGGNSGGFGGFGGGSFSGGGASRSF